MEKPVYRFYYWATSFNYWKDDSNDSMLVIMNKLTIIVYYKPVKVIINTPGLAKIIIEAIY